MNPSSYDQGFADGLLFVATILRRSATIVEAPIRGDYDSRDGRTVNAIARSGNSNLAAKYREVAAILESATKDSQT
jgi:hypothetical protein